MRCIADRQAVDTSHRSYLTTKQGCRVIANKSYILWPAMGLKPATAAQNVGHMLPVDLTSTLYAENSQNPTASLSR